MNGPIMTDDFTIIDGKKVLKDGRKVTVGIALMDHRIDDTALALHRPGHRPLTDAKATALRQSAYDKMLSDLGDAWRKPLPAAIKPRPSVQSDPSDKAYEAMVHGLEDAWRGPA